jgi:hypothetical protein
MQRIRVKWITKVLLADYPNFIFQSCRSNETNFIVTKSVNVEILDYNVSERKITITHDKRYQYFADYRLGIRFKQVGTKLEAGDPREFDSKKYFLIICQYLEMKYLLRHSTVTTLVS